MRASLHLASAPPVGDDGKRPVISHTCTESWLGSPLTPAFCTAALLRAYPLQCGESVERCLIWSLLITRYSDVMAQKTVRTDDLDNSSDAQTVRFSLDGKAYEIDLSPSNDAAFREALKPYVTAARRIGGAARKSTPSSAAALQAVRTWARDNGHEISDRGRVPTHIVEA